jgi:hypothetical protein
MRTNSETSILGVSCILLLLARNVSTRLRQRVVEIYEQSDGWLRSET